MKTQLHYYLVAMLLTFGIGMNAQIMDADYFNMATSVTSDWTFTNNASLPGTYAEVSDDIASASSGKSMKVTVLPSFPAGKKQVITSKSNSGGALELVAGVNYKLSMRVYLEGHADSAYYNKISSAMKSAVITDGGSKVGYMNFPSLELSNVRNEWQELSATFVYNATDINDGDVVNSVMVFNLTQATIVGTETGKMYIDDILIEAVPDPVTFSVKDEGALVMEKVNATVLEATSQTGSDGGVVFDLPNGEHTIVFAKNAYDMVYKTITVPVDGVVDVVMPKTATTQTAQIILIAQDATGASLVGAKVVAKDDNDVSVYAKATNVTGKVWISGLDEATFSYQMMGTNTYSGEAAFTARNRNLLVKEGVYNINLAVVNSTTNIDIINATVVLKDNADQVVTLIQDEAEFTYQGTDAAVGTFSYTVNADGFQEKTGSFDLTDMYNIDLRYIKLDPIVTDITNPDAIECTVFPNPSTGVVNIQTEAGADISVISLSGKVMMTVNNCPAYTSLSLDQLDAGLYLIEVQTANGKTVEKLQLK